MTAVRWLCGIEGGNDTEVDTRELKPEQIRNELACGCGGKMRIVQAPNIELDDGVLVVPDWFLEHTEPACTAVKAAWRQQNTEKKKSRS